MLTFIRRFLGLLVLLFGLWFLALPGIRVAWTLGDPGIRDGSIPAVSWKLHRSLTPRYGAWAAAWLKSNRGEQLSTDDIAGTEWPLFGSCFYLWATEALVADAAAKKIDSPMLYSREAVDAAADLVMDPRSAGWVRQHWGAEYLTKQNAFYRMLLIFAATSHQQLTGSDKHLAILRAQVESLAAEIDASPAGLLEDYPGQCYPTDIVAAILAIQRADAVLGTDHRAFVERALRGFTGKNVMDLSLPPYSADALSGRPHDRSRGCGNAYFMMHVPYLWPQQTEKWYASYEENFWQQDWLLAGFREFPKGWSDDFYFDVDSGPVVRGVGVAASAFGLAAARVNGRFDQATPQAAMVIAASWPLPDGTLLMPRLLSNATDAPYLGEAATLYCLTRTPATHTASQAPGSIPLVVWLALALYLGMGSLTMLCGWRWLRRT